MPPCPAANRTGVMRADLTKARGGKAIQVDTTMIQNEATWRVFRPDLEHPTESDFAAAS